MVIPINTLLGLVSGIVLAAHFLPDHAADSKNETEQIRADQDPMDDFTYAGRRLSQWIGLLESNDPRLRLSVARALGEIGPRAKAAVPSLIKRLGDEDEFIRSAAAFSLGEIGPEASAAVPAMVRAFREGDYFHQGIIIQGIAGIGPAAIPALIEISRKGGGARSVALRALGWIRPRASAAIPHLREMLAADEGSTRLEAAFSLWEISRHQPAIAIVARCLEDPGDSVRISAADHVGEIGPEAAAAVPALIRALDDPNEAVRNRSATALGKIGPAAKDAVPILVRSVGVPVLVGFVGGKPHQVSRPFVTEAITKIGAPAIPELIRGLRDQDEFTRGVAAESLGRIGPDAKAAVPALVETTREPRMVMRLVGANALWRIGRDERSIPILLEALKAGDPNDQLFAMKILAEVGPAGRDAVPLLIKILTQGDRFRRPEGAAEALGRIGPGAKAAVGALEAALHDPDGSIRVAAGLALWRVGCSEAALKALIGELQRPDSTVRYLAAMALGEFGPAARSAVPALIAALKNYPSDRPLIAQSLGRIGPDAQAAVPALVDVFENDSELGKEAAAKALKAIDPKAAALEGIR